MKNITSKRFRIVLSITILLGTLVGVALVQSLTVPGNEYVSDWDGRLVEMTPEMRALQQELEGLALRLADAYDDLVAEGTPLSAFYVDAFDKKALVVGLTSVTDQHIERIMAVLGDESRGRVVFVEMSYSLDELRSARDRISAHATELREKGVPITGIGINHRHGTILVTLEVLRPEYIEAIEEIAGPVPVEFSEGQPIWEVYPECEGDTNRDKCRPLLGGIQVEVGSWGFGDLSTLGITAIDINNELGYILVGHENDIGEEVWQPDWDLWGANGAGHITRNPLNNRESDAAWVERDEVSGYIFKTWNPDDHYYVGGWYGRSSQLPGFYVKKTGRTTGETAGLIHDNCVDMFSEYYDEWLECMVTATYSSAGGDSGSPVFTTQWTTSAIVYGIHAGRWLTWAAYSPIDQVFLDLDVQDVVKG